MPPPSLPLPFELLRLVVYVAVFLGVVYWLSSLADSKGNASRADKLKGVFGAAALLGSSFLLQLGMRDIGPIACEDMLVVGVPSAGGFARQARVVDEMGARNFLANYHLFIAHFRERSGGKFHVGHINTHPPGNILYFSGVTRLLDSSTKLRRLAENSAPAGSKEALEIVGNTWKVPFWFSETVPGLETAPVKLEADATTQEAVVYRAISDTLATPLSDAEGSGLWVGALGLRLAGAVTVLLTYLLGCKLYGRRCAAWAAALVGVCPALLLFAPSFDVLYACCGILTFWLIYSAARDKSPVKALLAGLVTYAGLFFSLAMLIVAALAVATVLVGWWQKRELAKELRSGRLWAVVALGVAGLTVPALTLRILTGYRSLAVWRVCLKANALFNQESGRSLWKWALYNPVDFLIFLGVPAGTLCLWGLAASIKSLRSWQRLKEMSVLPLVLVACILALNFSGKNLGEAGRLWLFLMPLVIISCVGMLCRFGKHTRKVVLLAAALQMLQVVMFRVFLNLMLMI